MSQESRISKLEASVWTRLAQEFDGPDVQDYILAAGMFEDAPYPDLVGHDADSIELAAWERHRRRVAAGESVGIPIDRLPPHIRNVLVDIGPPEPMEALPCEP